MKIRFTVTISETTLQGFKASGVVDPQEIIAALKEPMQSLLDEMSAAGDVEQDEDGEVI